TSGRATITGATRSSSTTGMPEDRAHGRRAARRRAAHEHFLMRRALQRAARPSNLPLHDTHLPVVHRKGSRMKILTALPASCLVAGGAVVAAERPAAPPAPPGTPPSPPA